MTGWWQLKYKNRPARERRRTLGACLWQRPTIEKIVCCPHQKQDMAESNESRFILFSSSSYQTSHFGFWGPSRKSRQEIKERENQPHREPAAWLLLDFIGQGIRRMSSAFKIPIKDKSEYFGLRYTHNCVCPCCCSSGRNEWRFFDASVSPSIVA